MQPVRILGPRARRLSPAEPVDVTRPAVGGLELRTTLDLNYSDSYTFNPTLDPRSEQDSFTKVNLRLGLRGDWWELMAYGRNIFDEEVFMQSFDVPVLVGSHAQYLEEGQIWGARLTARF